MKIQYSVAFVRNTSGQYFEAFFESLDEAKITYNAFKDKGATIYEFHEPVGFAKTPLLTSFSNS